MNNNPNNYKFDPNTGEPLLDNSSVSNNNVALPKPDLLVSPTLSVNNIESAVTPVTEPINPNPYVKPVTPVTEPINLNPYVKPVTPATEPTNPNPYVKPVTPATEPTNPNPYVKPVTPVTEPINLNQSIEHVNNSINNIGTAASQVNTNVNTGFNQVSQQGYVPPVAPPSAPGYVPPINRPVYGITNNPEYKKKKSGGKKFAVVFFYIFILAIIGAGVAAFLVPKKKSTEPKNLSRTIMVYMSGSDLESKTGFGTAELDSINFDKMDNENINVVVIAGGAKKWHNDYIDTDETSIFELTADGYKKVKKQNLKNMGDSNVLSSFLNYVYENYKSDKYDLIFWDHGAAILGAEIDELHNNDFLTLEEMNKALKDSPFNEDNKIELVIFSTCLNGTIEVANIFKDYADYLVASEETTMSVYGGNDLEFVMNIESTDKAYDVAYKFVDNYKTKMNNFYKLAKYNATKAYSTYSIIDLENVSELVSAVDDFFDDIDVSDNYNDISRVRANIYQYPSVDSTYDMVDLYNLVDGLKELSPKKAQKVLDLLETTIAYNWATNSKSRGLSIYFPYKASSEYTRTYKIIYNNFKSLKNYDSFITKFYSIKSNSKPSHKSYKENKTTVDYKNGEADFTIELTKDQLDTFASGYYYVFRKNEDGTYKPVYTNGKTDLKGNKLNAKIKGKQLVVKSDGECPEGHECVDEYPLILDELDIDDNYIRYTTNVILEDFSKDDWVMDPAVITLVYNTKTGKVDIADVNPLSNDDNNTPTRTSLNINDYKTIAFSASSSYTITDDDLISNGVITGIETPTDDFYFELSNFDDGYEYYCIFVIEDTYGNTFRSKLIKMN
ncbi:MAG: hypothetical protein IKN87_01970 [Bacilli bacterium]|nr:hypothetical protein [Bacilli bacterium]